MKIGKRVWVKTGVLAAGAVLILAGLAPYAQATAVQIGFNGAGGTGHASLTVGPDYLPSIHPAGPTDPAGAQLVTGASGTFSDANLGLYNVAITGVLARNFALPFDMKAGGSWHSGDLPFPASFSQLAAIGGTGGVVTYSDLFYAGGSPQSCWDYPFAGGLLDTYGVMFTLSNGGFVDLWSDGSIFVPTMSPVYLTYGFAVILPTSKGNSVSDFQFSGVHAAVPEPKFMWLFGAAVLGLFAWRRSTETRKRVSHTV